MHHDGSQPVLAFVLYENLFYNFHILTLNIRAKVTEKWRLLKLAGNEDPRAQFKLNRNTSSFISSFQKEKNNYKS